VRQGTAEVSAYSASVVPRLTSAGLRGAVDRAIEGSGEFEFIPCCWHIPPLEVCANSGGNGDISYEQQGVAINRAAMPPLQDGSMRIHGLCLVKNEADVLQETLVSALYWCDQIYVFDNGSNDGTWELVKDLAQQHPQIVAYKQDDVLYTNGLRADIFNAFRLNAEPKDWWCALDADEFYIDDPRIFLAKVPNIFQTVWSASLDFCFTDRDLYMYEQDPRKFLKTPVQQRFRYYINNWGELRFFRHSGDIVWTRNEGGFPPVMFPAPAYPVRIWLKHYRYRSPEQIERRLRTRRPAIEAGTGFWHERKQDWMTTVATKTDAPLDFENTRPEFAGSRWEERIVPAASLEYDALDRRYVVNESLMPEFPVRLRRSRLKSVIPEPIRARLGRLKRQILPLLGSPQPSR
jgi:Glycosyl transferase family 2